MDLLGVGPLELVFVLLIIFLVINPKDIAATGKKIGRFLSTVRKSEFWKGVTQVSKEMRSLPTTLMREAELEDAKKELAQDMKDVGNISQEFKIGDFMDIKQNLKTGVTKDSEPNAADSSNLPESPDVDSEMIDASDGEEKEE